MITCTRRIEFDAAHRVMNHESVCKMLHGHRYVLEVTFVASELDNLGRVIDFGVIRDFLKDWINNNWDHNTILNIADQDLGNAIASKILGQKIYYMNCNPTAENMAKYLFSEVCPKLFSAYNVRCLKIKIFETPNCSAEVC